MSADTTKTAATPDVTALLDAWIADVMSGETGGRTKGNAEGKALGMLQTFASSDQPVLTIDTIPSDWTVTRQGRDADAPVSMREVYTYVKRAVSSMPDDTPIYLASFSSDDNEVRVLNTNTASKEALNAHADVIRSRVLAHARAVNANKALGPNAPASHVRAAQDRVNKTEARLNAAKSDAIRLLSAVQAQAQDA